MLDLGFGFAMFTIAGTVTTAELAPEGRLGEVAGLPHDSVMRSIQLIGELIPEFDTA